MYTGTGFVGTGAMVMRRKRVELPLMLDRAAFEELGQNGEHLVGAPAPGVEILTGE